METYQLQIPEANSGESAWDAVDVAFEDESDLTMEGVREGVSVELTVSVSRLTRYRQDGEVLIRFSGITKPEGLPYVAEFNGSAEESPFVDVVVGPRQ